MYHKLKLSSQEKIEAWLNLCDFTFELMEKNLGKRDFLQRLKSIREDQVKANCFLLRGLSRIK